MSHDAPRTAASAEDGLDSCLRYGADVEVEQPHEADDISAVRDIFAELRASAYD